MIHRRMTEETKKDIDDELVRQYLKWGEQNHSNYKWLTIILEEFGEAGKEALEADFAKSKNDLKDYQKRIDMLYYELIQVAASTISMMECIKRNDKQN